MDATPLKSLAGDEPKVQAILMDVADEDLDRVGDHVLERRGVGARPPDHLAEGAERLVDQGRPELLHVLYMGPFDAPSSGYSTTMWAGIAVVFVIALVAVSFAAGGAWLIFAVPLAILVLLPLAFLRFSPHRGGVESLREEREHARPAIKHASEVEDSVLPPNVP